MSAFRISNDHIDAMLTAATSPTILRGWGPLRWFPEGVDGSRQIEYGQESKIGRMLIEANYKSVDERYNETETRPRYKFQPLSGTPDPKTVINAVRCYEYQSCEASDWKTSEAKAFCDALTDACVRKLCAGDETWEINDRQVFAAKAVAA